MSSSRPWIQTCVLLLTCFGFTSPSLARSSFDGAWSVVVVTRAGACTPTVRYPVAITNGIVTNGGGSPASVSGRVAPTGAVRVTVQSGGSWATGSGHVLGCCFCSRTPGAQSPRRLSMSTYTFFAQEEIRQSVRLRMRDLLLKRQQRP